MKIISFTFQVHIYYTWNMALLLLFYGYWTLFSLMLKLTLHASKPAEELFVFWNPLSFLLHLKNLRVSFTLLCPTVLFLAP